MKLKVLVKSATCNQHLSHKIKTYFSLVVIAKYKTAAAKKGAATHFAGGTKQKQKLSNIYCAPSKRVLMLGTGIVRNIVKLAVKVEFTEIFLAFLMR